ncbi:hypothetical protein OXX59_007993 [Metschnikowia pulcherrima]
MSATLKSRGFTPDQDIKSILAAADDDGQAKIAKDQRKPHGTTNGSETKAVTPFDDLQIPTMAYYSDDEIDESDEDNEADELYSVKAVEGLMKLMTLLSLIRMTRATRAARISETR